MHRGKTINRQDNVHINSLLCLVQGGWKQSCYNGAEIVQQDFSNYSGKKILELLMLNCSFRLEVSFNRDSTVIGNREGTKKKEISLEV